MGAKVVSITTDGAGAGSVDIRFYGVLHAVGLRLGTLSTPDVEFIDYLTDTTVVAVAGVAATTVWLPRVAVVDDAGDAIADAYDKPAITGVIQVNIAGGGAAKTGEIVLIW